MVPDQSKTSLGLEYFCTEGDDLWSMSDEDLVELARSEIDKIGLARSQDVEDGCVIRVPKAYPVYDGAYARHLAVLREFIDSLDNFQTVGRNGLHRYNNQDHAMFTAMYAVNNAVLGEKNDLWNVNVDQEYHEEVRQEPGRNKQYIEATIQLGLSEVLRKLDRVAFGAGVAAVCGLGLFLMTMILVLKGGAAVGPMLGLLSHFLPGYEVTSTGSLVGLGYGIVGGFAVGWVFALLRNTAMFFYFSVVRRREERGFLKDLLDFL